MSVPVTYAEPATQCPALLWPTTLRDPATAVPVVVPRPGYGGSALLAPRLDTLAVIAEILAVTGGGAYAIDPMIGGGCMLSADGTTLDVLVDTGVVLIDGPVLPGTPKITVADNLYSWIWLSRGGVLSAVTGSDHTMPPAALLTAGAFLGRALSAGGVITGLDRSGVLEIRGGHLYRKTGDLDIPSDTPPFYVILETETQSGIWRWNGTYYEQPAQRGMFQATFASADYTLPAADYYREYLEAIGTNSGPQNFILPLNAGLGYDVFNNTGQTVTFKSSSGTGVAVANGKRARIRCNGTNWVRITADA